MRVPILLACAVTAAACSHAPVLAPAAATAAAPPGTPEIPYYPDAEVASVKSPHDFRGKPLCQSCHERNAALRDDAIALCRQCHADGHGNHVVGVVQRTPAEGVRLLPGGLVACHSCHDPHAVQLKPRGGLWMTADALCVRCHTGHH